MNRRTVLCTAAAVALLLVSVPYGLAETETASTNGLDLEATALQEGPALVGPEGVEVKHVAVTVTSTNEAAAITAVTIWMPDDVELLDLQSPPDGWAVLGQGNDGVRDYISYTGYLAAGSASDPASQDFRLRLAAEDVGQALAEADMFEADITGVELDALSGAKGPLSQRLDAVLQSSGALAANQYACQLLIVSTVEGQASYLPFGSLSDVATTGAQVLVAVFDTKHGEYVPASEVTGTVSVETATQDGTPITNEGTLEDLPLTDSGVLPVRDAVDRPVLDPAAGAIDVAAATLWSGEDGERAWFEAHPGSFRVFATAQVAGVAGDVCLEQPYQLEAAAAPPSGDELVTHSIATPYTMVPPEIDSDGDGYANLAELRSNSNPLMASSTPYTDDDCDGTPNGQDALPIPRLDADKQNPVVCD